MKFYTRKRRAPSIIIVSLIDILAILLIFFIVTTTFRKAQPALEINLPESKTAQESAATDKQPIVLRVKSENEITLDENPVLVQNLASSLADVRAKNPDRAIALQADRNAPFGLIVNVLDALKAAGIQNIPAFTQPEEKK